MAQLDNPVFATLTAYDQGFCYRTPALESVSWFERVSGKRPVLISAPHACAHRRDGVVKMQEEYTGALALYLAERCGCSAIVTRYQTDEDPNWQAESEFKASLKALVSELDIGFVIDLHGMTNRYHMGIALGTINGASCNVDLLLPHFTRAGFIPTTVDNLSAGSQECWRRLVVDHPKFTGGVVNHTVTRFAATELNIPAVQIELASEVRVVKSAATDDWPYDYHGNTQAIIATVSALENLVNAIA